MPLNKLNSARNWKLNYVYLIQLKFVLTEGCYRFFPLVGSVFTLMVLAVSDFVTQVKEASISLVQKETG